MGAAYDLFLKVIEDGTLNDEFEGFKVMGRYHASYSNNVYIIVQASTGIKMTEHFAPWKVKFDIDFDIKPVMTDDEKVAEHRRHVESIRRFVSRCQVTVLQYLPIRICLSLP